jgi:hypothetical protein
MADYNSSVPVRTATNGDVVAQLVDGTTITQKLSINVAGQALVLDASDGSPTGGTAALYSSLMGGVYNLVPPLLTTGQQASLQLNSAGQLLVAASVVFPYDENWGVVGPTTLRTAAQIGNATGAADFNAGATTGQTLRVIANQGAANILPWSQNITQIIGSAPSATNALPVQVTLGTTFISPSNPLPVTMAAITGGTPRNFYTDSPAVAAGTTVTQSTLVAGATGFYLQQVFVASEARFKAIVQVETGVATSVFNIVFAAFGTAATSSVAIPVPNEPLVATGARIQVLMTNLDLGASDMYSTISGYQV